MFAVIICWKTFSLAHSRRFPTRISLYFAASSVIAEKHPLSRMLLPPPGRQDGDGFFKLNNILHCFAMSWRTTHAVEVFSVWHPCWHDSIVSVLFLNLLQITAEKYISFALTMLCFKFDSRRFQLYKNALLWRIFSSTWFSLKLTFFLTAKSVAGPPLLMHYRLTGERAVISEDGSR